VSPGTVIVEGTLWIAGPLAVLAGALSFASPCVLPLVPGYLGYLGGASTVAVGDSPAGKPPRRRLVLGTALFVAGFTVVFVAVTILGGALGFLLLRYADLIAKVLGFGTIALGLIFVGFLGLGQRTIRLPISKRAGLIGAPLLGMALGIGWTPCIGPTLAAIVSISWNLGDPVRAGMLGLAYSMGLGIPFVALAVGWNWAMRSTTFLRRHVRVINIVGGALLILLGVCMVTGLWSRLMSSMQQVVINVPLPL